MKLIAYLLRHSRRLLIISIVAGTASGAANAGVLALINSALAGRGSAGRLALGFTGLCLLTVACRGVSEVLFNYIGERTILAMRTQLSHQVLAVPLRQLEEIGAHRVLSTLTDDVPTVSLVVGVLPSMSVSAAVLIGALAYLGWLSWQVMALLLVLLAFGLASYQLPFLRGLRVMLRARELADGLYKSFRALTEGAKELRLNRRRQEDFLDRDLLATAEQVRIHNTRAMRIFTLTGSWGQLLVFFAIGMLLFVLPAVTPTSRATLTGYTLTLLFLMTPLQTLMNVLPTLSRANVALNRIDSLGFQLAATASREAAAPAPLAASWRLLELDGVTHAYQREGHEGRFVVGPIDLRLTPGELVFIAGGNGSGKTTLAKVLTGLYLPDSGEIRLDGEAIADANRDAYRQLFAAVFFDFFLFHTLLGVEQAGLDAKAAQLLAGLELQHKVRVEDGRLTTTDLSQGQRKRLALLTAFLEDRPIYLFDEWAADQDPHFKEVFYREVLPRLKAEGKTAVVITHDDRYYPLADRVIKLEEGKIVAEHAGGG
jgi:putative ATP-binding cassette transporter